ncbi:MAG: rhodanese-like domain-containing protein [Saprospiraceae bacterium]|nr:rhodanese-like domain-containing protein [Saprospiraceae bacterium]
MRFTFSLLLLLAFQACKNDAGSQENQAVNNPATQGTKTGVESGLKPETEKIGKRQAFEVLEETIKVMPAEDFDQFLQINSNTPLIDLRSVKEYNTAHILRAVNIPFESEGFENKIKDLQGATNVAIYCSNGIQSNRAAQTLKKLEIKKIRILKNGLQGWAIAHKMLVRDQPKTKNK